MAGFNGSGVFERVYRWVVQAGVNGGVISATEMDEEFDEIAAALSLCLTKDGQNNTINDQLIIDTDGVVSDGGNDYGLTITSNQPGIQLRDKTASAGSGLIFLDGTTLKIMLDTQNDNQIGASTNTSDFDVIEITPSLMSFLNQDGLTTSFATGDWNFSSVNANENADFSIDGQDGYDVNLNIKQGGALKGKIQFDDSINQLALARYANVGAAYLGGLLLNETDLTVDNLPLKIEDQLQVDTINEFTLNNGVDIEGILLKDGTISSTTKPTFICDSDNNSLNDGFIFAQHDTTIANRRMLLTDGGNLSVYGVHGGAIISAFDAGAANITEANPIYEFRQVNGVGTSSTRLGYMGYGSTGNQHLYFQNDNPLGDNIYVSQKGHKFYVDDDNNDASETFEIINSSDTVIHSVDETGNLAVNGNIRNMSGNAISSIMSDNYYLSGVSNGMIDNSGNVVVQQTASSNLILENRSIGSIVHQIDSNNNGSVESFQIRHDGTGIAGGSPLFTVAENGSANFYGLIDTNGNDITTEGGDLYLGSNDYITHNDTSNEFQFLSDGSINNSTLRANAINFGNDDLDEYIKGTFTPSITNIGGGTIPITEFARNEYLKNGDECIINCLLKVGASPSDDECRMSLPFNANNLQLLHECWILSDSASFPTVSDVEDSLTTDGVPHGTVHHGSGIIRDGYLYFKTGAYQSIGSYAIDHGWLHLTFRYRTT